MPVTKEGLFSRDGKMVIHIGRIAGEVPYVRGQELSARPVEAERLHIRSICTDSHKGRELAQRPIGSLAAAEVAELTHQVTRDLSLLELVNPKAKESIIALTDAEWTEEKREEVARLMFASLTDERLDSLEQQLTRQFVNAATVADSNIPGMALVLIRAEKERRGE